MHTLAAPPTQRGRDAPVPADAGAETLEGRQHQGFVRAVHEHTKLLATKTVKAIVGAEGVVHDACHQQQHLFGGLQLGEEVGLKLISEPRERQTIDDKAVVEQLDLFFDGLQPLPAPGQQFGLLALA